MTNLVKHFDDANLYYDIDVVLDVRIDPIALTITMTYSGGQLAVESGFADVAAQQKRLEEILNLTNASSSQYP